jgi:predicted nucleic acid-binding Zn ribbon protein
MGKNLVFKKDCMQCTKRFESIFPNKKFCSDKCRQKYNQYTERAKLADKKKYALNKELYKKRNKSRYAAKKDEILEKQKIYLKNLSTEKNSKRLENKKNWYKTPKGRAHSRQLNQKKRRLIRTQTPKWNDKAKTDEIFRITAKIEESFNKYVLKNNMPKVKLNVDHIVPLQGITFEEGAPVSGLNVWYNLMPTLESDNKQKHKLCPPSKRIEGVKTNHLTLDKLPLPKHWMRFIRSMYSGALKAEKDSSQYRKMQKSFMEINPRNLKS